MQHEQLRVRQGGKGAGLQAFDGVLGIAAVLLCGGQAAKVELLVRPVKMAAQDEEVQPLLLFLLQKPGMVLRIILGFQAQIEVDFALKTLLQVPDALQVIREEGQVHADVRGKTVRIRPRAVVGKAQGGIAVVYGR